LYTKVSRLIAVVLRGQFPVDVDPVLLPTKPTPKKRTLVNHGDLVFLVFPDREFIAIYEPVVEMREHAPGRLSRHWLAIHRDEDRAKPGTTVQLDVVVLAVTDV
jgi:hypothetical protein